MVKITAVQDRALFSVFPLLKTANLLQIYVGAIFFPCLAVHIPIILLDSVFSCAVYFAKFLRSFLLNVEGLQNKY